MDFGEKLFRDEKMTVLMVKKYLLTKLGLSNQAEVTKRKTISLFLSNKLKVKEKIITYHIFTKLSNYKYYVLNLFSFIRLEEINERLVDLEIHSKLYSQIIHYYIFYIMMLSSFLFIEMPTLAFSFILWKCLL